MNRFSSLMMYILWIATIIAVISTTFTNFQYEDLNFIAGGLFIFSLLNSLLIAKTKK